MRTGVFAILDCLGFKGYWRTRNVSAEELLRFLVETKTNAKGYAKVDALLKNVAGDRVELNVAFISDTVVISAMYKEGFKVDEHAGGYLVGLTASVCAEIQHRFLRAPSPLALRGCIAVGEHLVVENFFAGPAVDEAASLSETAQGAFIWLTPAASTALKRYAGAMRRLVDMGKNLTPEKRFASSIELMKLIFLVSNVPISANFKAKWEAASVDKKLAAFEPLSQIFIAKVGKPDVLFDYPMPVKSGGNLIVGLVNPFPLSQSVDFDETERLMVESFDASSIDVLIKRQHTELFLSKARAASVDALNQHGRDVAQHAKVLDGILE